MGRACLRSDGHRRPVRGAGRTTARRRQAGGNPALPDLAGAHARPELLRRGGDTDCETVGIGQPIGNRDRQRLGDPLPVADRDAVSVGERQPESLGLALA